MIKQWAEMILGRSRFDYRLTVCDVQTTRPIILLLGPTAGGKTQLAIELAQRLARPGSAFGGECISADSMQVYRGMDIGTAKPTPQERLIVPHHLLDVADPSEDSFSVDRWLDLTDEAIEDIRSRDHFPIIVGGTNLYVQTLLAGMMQGPEPDLSRRAALNEMNGEQLRRMLEQADPPAAQRIHPNDRKRTIRAIEVFEQTGTRLSELQTQWAGSGQSADALNSKSKIQNPIPFRKDVLIIGLDYPVETINRRINARVKAMIDAGFVDEVRRLRGSKSLGRNAREALGYKQIIEHLEDRMSLEDSIEQIKIRTRRYAKQQRTWLRKFRHRPEKSLWIDAAAFEWNDIVDQALNWIVAQSIHRA